jgi:hypothetical protein
MTNHESHKKLWLGLYKTGGNDKKKVAKKLKLGPENGAACFACDACNGKCSECPIIWIPGVKKESMICCDAKSPYYKWSNAETKEERKQLAKIIAELYWED